MIQDTRDLFESIGGDFITPIEQIANRLGYINAFIFDWDGVFNEGVKFGDQGSPFAEIDSMGTNLVRLAYWLQNERQMPVCGIITGAVNAGTEYFVNREGFHFVIRGFTDKSLAWQMFQDRFDIPPEQVLYVFDDVLDLPIARQCGLRMMIGNSASPAFRDYCERHELCDYITGHRGGQGAVREAMELLLMLNGMYDQAVNTRIEYAEDGYLEYLDARSSIEPIHITNKM